MKRAFSLLALLLFMLLSFAAGVHSEKLKAARDSKGKVTGIGGIFFKSKDPKSLRAWYSKKLGLNMDDSGSNFEWRNALDAKTKGFTQWGAFKESTTYFEPSKNEFMINYRVNNLESLLTNLAKSGISPVDKVESEKYGKFVHIMDPEGHKIELWEANDEEYEKLCKGKTTF